MTAYQLSWIVFVTILNIYTAYLLRYSKSGTVGWWLCHINGVLAALGVFRLLVVLFSPT